jgi:hypothetical protein
MAYVRKDVVGEEIYVQVVRCKRINGKPVQEFLCSLGEVTQLINKLQSWKNE